MARALFPAGIHIAPIIVDGVVDLATTRAKVPDKPDDCFVDPAAVAEIAWNLTQRSHRAWSFEVETRRFGESWSRAPARHPNSTQRDISKRQLSADLRS